MRRFVPRGSVVTAILLGVAVVAVAAFAVFAWYDADRSAAREQAGKHALDTARAATRAIFSYDYRTFDASVANGQQFVTGEFADEYAKTTESLKAAAEKEKAIVRAEVMSAGVISAAEDKVEILLYVNQYRRNANIEGEKVDQNRVVLTMVPVDGRWKVVQAAAI